MTKRPNNFRFYRRYIKTTAYLENTRMLFDYMQELNYRYRQSSKEKERYTGYCGTGGLARRYEIQEELKRHIQTVTEKCLNPHRDEAPEEPLLLQQNPLSAYLKFYLNLFPNISKDKSRLAEDMGKELSPMLNYFNILQYLTEEEFTSQRDKTDHHTSLPYFYEDLCLSIREMTGCHACFLLYHEKGEMTELIARSGYVVDGEAGLLANLNLKISELDSIIKQFSASAKLSYDIPGPAGTCTTLTFSRPFPLAEGIKRINGTAQQLTQTTKHTYLIFEFPYFQEGRQDEGDRNFYLLLDYPGKNEGDLLSSEKEKPAALKVLFLRHRLWEALRQDYAELIDYRFDCSYIRPVQAGAPSFILHITDLHIGDDDRWNPGGRICQRFCKSIDDQYSGKIELLAVTGDIVNASQHASDAQAKYRRIGRFLQEAAIHLWAAPSGSSGVQILSHDWKRRIMVVTGNHDYTAMSDVLVETGAREIKNALPAGDSGGTMSKFTYYIEFLINFLDAPIDELLENDLNEIRDYKYLDLKVALLNTCSQANAKQNNKVEINLEKLSRLMKCVPWHSTECSRHYVVLMHHAPDYQIDYFADRYEIHKFIQKQNITQAQYDGYIDLLTHMISTARCRGGRTYIDPLSSAQETQLKRLQSLLSQQNSSEFLKSALRADISSLTEILERRTVETEFHRSFLSNSKDLRDSQQLDQKKFETACGKILGSQATTVLAGHEHKWRFNTAENQATHVGPKFYTENKKKKGSGSSKPDIVSYIVVSPKVNAAGLHSIYVS